MYRPGKLPGRASVWSCRLGGIVYVYFLLECSDDPPESHPGQHAFTFVIGNGIPSTSLTTVSIFSVCCCSRYIFISMTGSLTRKTFHCFLSPPPPAPHTHRQEQIWCPGSNPGYQTCLWGKRGMQWENIFWPIQEMNSSHACVGGKYSTFAPSKTIF